MMARTDLAQAVLGLDFGAINTRATLFGIENGKYRVLGQQVVPTLFGPKHHLGACVDQVLAGLARTTHHTLLQQDGRLIMPVDSAGDGVDRMALTISAGQPLRTVLCGLTELGSLAAVRALADSMPLNQIGAYSLGDLNHADKWMSRLLDLQPELVLIAGGESGGAEQSVDHWITSIRHLCLLLPEAMRPAVIFAGNASCQKEVQRRLEPFTQLHLCANVQPGVGQFDLVPSQKCVDQIILQQWLTTVNGLADLERLAPSSMMTADFGLNRVARFLSRTSPDDGNESRGVLLADLGGARTALAVAQRGDVQYVSQPVWDWQVGEEREQTLTAIQQWLAEPLPPERVAAYLQQHAISPAILPMTQEEWEIDQAFCRYRLQSACQQLEKNYPHVARQIGNCQHHHLEPIVISGAVVTQAAHWGQVMMTVLDGLQPCGITTVVVDRYQILPLMGQMSDSLPLLAVQVLESEAFLSLGTVIIPVSAAEAGAELFTMDVIKDSGTQFSVDVQQGTLRRLILQPGEPAVLVLKPERHTDVGFGGPGVGGRLRITGGELGVVIDARGRPLALPADDEQRVAQLQRWSWTLAG